MELYLFRGIHNLIRVTACLEIYLRSSTTIRENLLGGVTEISDGSFSLRRSWPVLFVFNIVEAVFLDVRRPNTAQLTSDEART